MDKLLPLFVISTIESADTRNDILNKLSDSGFDIKFVPPIGTVGGERDFLQYIMSILKTAINHKKKFIIICQEDLAFTKDYNFGVLQRLISRADGFDADAFIVGPNRFDYGVKVSKDLYWLNAFMGFQFIIVFSRFYEKLKNYSYKYEEKIEFIISQCSERIFTAVNPLSFKEKSKDLEIMGRHDESGDTDKLISDIVIRLNVLKKMHAHFDILGEIPKVEEKSYRGVQVPTYIINLPERTDRLKHIEKQFESRDEFAIQVVKACRSKNGALGLWYSIKKIVQQALDTEEDVIIICEDDHTFSKMYTKDILFKAIYQGVHIGADLILGGISDTRQGVVVSTELCWIDTFRCTQFTIIYRGFFAKILTTVFNNDDTADLKLSSMTANKYVIHPFISSQQDFGYSDIPIEGLNTAVYQSWFDNCAQKLNNIRSISEKYKVI